MSAPQWPGQFPLRETGRLRLLIVENNVDLSAALDEALSDRHALAFAGSAGEALALHPERFDGIVTDYRMPAMSGLEFYTALRERGVPVPVVLMSSDPYVGRRAEGFGFLAFLAKPFGFAELHAVLVRIAQRLGRARRSPLLH